MRAKSCSNGRSVTHLKPWQRDVSTVFQSYALFPSPDGAWECGVRPARAARERPIAQTALCGRWSWCNSAAKRDRYPAQFSGGEKQRVALARSVVLAPQLLLLDEPLAALDPKLRLQMRAELKSMQRTTGITFLLVTHDQEEALSLSDRLAVMNRGKIEQFGHPAKRFICGPPLLSSLDLWGPSTGSALSASGRRRHKFRETVPAGVRDRRATVEDTVFLGNCVN